MKLPGDVTGSQLTVPKERIKLGIGFGSVVGRSAGPSGSSAELTGKWCWKRRMKRKEIRCMEQFSLEDKVLPCGERVAPQTARLLKDL